MSLNGLDSTAVKEAHDKAVSEPGGWFLLQYASRDEVGLLSHGSGGIVEIRDAIAKYEEPSPLFGFLRYRRRNVILKYLPEGCSRLVQARVTVHFNAVSERFAPYHTTFDIVTAKDLKDTKLSAACSLHTASSSTSSSASSLRRRRLMEIAEEEEEEQRATKRQSVVVEEDTAPVTLNAQLAKFPIESHFAGTADLPSFAGLDRPGSSAATLDSRRLSSQLSRSEMHSFAYQYGKPKVKLAPRPSADMSGRPRTSSSTNGSRPVSSIPAGFKLFSKGSRRGKDTTDTMSFNDVPRLSEAEETADVTATTTAVPAAIPAPPMPNTLDVKRPYTSSGRPTSSSGISVKSVATTTTPSSKMTVEKARLMKAMKLREKKKKMSMLPPPPLPVPTVDIIEPPAEPTHNSENAKNTDVTLDDSPSAIDDQSQPVDEFTAPTNSGDSAIDVSPTAADQVSVDTHTTDSHPPSPLAMSSEVDSTKASSLSDSTDETAKPAEEQDSNKEADAGADTDAEVDKGSQPTPVVDALGISSIDTTASEQVVVDDAQPLVEQSADQGDKTGEQQSSLAKQATSDENLKLPTSQTSNASTQMAGNLPTGDDTAKLSSLETQTLTPVAVTVEPASASRPTTSTTDAPGILTNPECTSSPLDKAAVSAIEVPQSLRDSQSTIGQETTESASATAKRARRKALVDPILTSFNSGLSKDAARSETNLSDDESLLEELHPAAVEEAQTITVFKSPVNAVFPSTSPSKLSRSPGDGRSNLTVRTVSNPVRGNLLGPGDVATSSARSVSSGAAFLHKMAQQAPPALAPKKSNIGSSISQRIKALEKLSGSSPPVSEAPVRVERPTSTFFSVRKASGRDASDSPSVVKRASSLSRQETPSPPTTRDESSPDGSKLVLPRSRSGSVANRLSVFQNGSKPRGRPESIQVRARIIRDPAQPFPKAPDVNFDPSELGQLNLKQSPLVVDHQRAVPMPTLKPSPHLTRAAPDAVVEPVPKRESIKDRRMSKEKRLSSQSQDQSTIGDDYEGTRPRRRSSLSIVKDFIKDRRGAVLSVRSQSQDNLNILSPSLSSLSKAPSRPPSVHTNAGLARRLSISSRRSSISRDRDFNTSSMAVPLSPSLMTETGGSSDEAKSTKNEVGHKTQSGGKGRTSRFMRRLSSSLGSVRKNSVPIISPTLAEVEEGNYMGIPVSRGSSTAVQQTTVTYIGDVNVQFPDNLLWKRRTMYLDSQGFMILATVNGVTTSTTATSITSSDRSTGTIKRYHLSDFRTPYIPEMEVQELPNSVCLDLVDGSGLQVACEDRAGQSNVLCILLEAHQNHATFGQ